MPPLDYSLAQPSVGANPLDAYAQGEEMQQKSFERAAARQTFTQRQEIMKDLASENRAGFASAISPLQQAEKLERTVPKLLAIGDFQTANTMTNSAKELRLNASETSKESQRKQLAKFEDSAKAAQASINMPDDPLLESEAINSYLKAGGNAQIASKASTGSPEDKRRAMKEISMSAMDSTKRLDAENKIAEQLEQRKSREAAEKARLAEKLWMDRQNIGLREGALSQKEAAAAGKTAKEGVVAQRQTKSVIDAGKNLTSTLDALAASPIHTTSAFGMEVAHGGLFAVGMAKYAANKITPDDKRRMDVMMSGFKREVGLMMTAFSPRGMTEAMSKELSALDVKSADTVGNAQFVISEGISVARNALESVDTTLLTDEQKAKIESLKKRFEQVPTMEDLQKQFYGAGIDTSQTAIPKVTAPKPYEDAAKEKQYQDWLVAHPKK